MSAPTPNSRSAPSLVSLSIAEADADSQNSAIQLSDSAASTDSLSVSRLSSFPRVFVFGACFTLCRRVRRLGEKEDRGIELQNGTVLSNLLTKRVGKKSSVTQPLYSKFQSTKIRSEPFAFQRTCNPVVGPGMLGVGDMNILSCFFSRLLGLQRRAV